MCVKIQIMSFEKPITANKVPEKNSVDDDILNRVLATEVVSVVTGKESVNELPFEVKASKPIHAVHNEPRQLDNPSIQNPDASPATTYPSAPKKTM